MALKIIELGLEIDLTPQNQKLVDNYNFYKYYQETFASDWSQGKLKEEMENEATTYSRCQKLLDIVVKSLNENELKKALEIYKYIYELRGMNTKHITKHSFVADLIYDNNAVVSHKNLEWDLINKFGKGKRYNFEHDFWYEN